MFEPGQEVWVSATVVRDDGPPTDQVMVEIVGLYGGREALWMPRKSVSS